jgi:uncharacterized Zn finger protein
VPVAERQEKARKQAEKLTKKKGETLSPVVVSGRNIAATFWGKAWCQNLERYSDYANRIPRGRAYVRNGSVIDLKIAPGQVIAQVSGTHLYTVKIEIRPLKPDVWQKIKNACMGKIGSLIELLQGKLSGEVMEIVTRQHTGLFPEPAEISFHCSCPDWASMCKHVAATLYGIGARLDREPELLFLLRGVDHRELIAAPETTARLAASLDIEERGIAEEDISAIFGIEIDTGKEAPQGSPPRQKRSKKEEVQAISPHAATSRRGRRPLAEKGATRQGRKATPETGATQPTPPSVSQTATTRSAPRPAPHTATTKATPKPAPQTARTNAVRKTVPKTPPTATTDTPEQAKPRRGRPPKASDATAIPLPPKRKTASPGLPEKTEASKQPTPLPGKQKRTGKARRRETPVTSVRITEARKKRS